MRTFFFFFPEKEIIQPTLLISRRHPSLSLSISLSPPQPNLFISATVGHLHPRRCCRFIKSLSHPLSINLYIVHLYIIITIYLLRVLQNDLVIQVDCLSFNQFGNLQQQIFSFKMLGSNNNTVVPIFLDENHYQYPVDVSNQLQLFSNVPAGCNVNPVNYFGREHKSPVFRSNKRGRETEPNVRQQKLQISLNRNSYHDESDRPTSIPSQNPVSTGLKLSYDDEERNSSITSASGSMTGAQSMMLSFGDSISSELDRQKEEFDRYIKTQEENLVKGVRDIKQRHMTSFLASLEKGVSKKLLEKDLELEAINRKNRELVNQIKQVASEAQNWHYKAKYNESVVNILKSDLQQALSQGAELVKEGFGDSDIDDTASWVDPGKSTMAGKDKKVICRCCKAKEVSVLVMPCRHLSLCIDCDGFVNACPVCQLGKTASVQVFLA